VTLIPSAVSLRIADYSIGPLDSDGERHVTSAVSHNTKDSARLQVTLGFSRELISCTQLCIYVQTVAMLRSVTRFLGAFGTLRIETISFVTSVCLSVWNNSDPTGRIFMKFDI
jgi:hypothetical protein